MEMLEDGYGDPMWWKDPTQKASLLARNVIEKGSPVV